jgi:prepilin-type N-terminal cleavage/methylation domain-containing protein
MKLRGFTIIELIIVIAILLILAAGAFGGTGGIIRGLRFSNTFNKMILMVQQARSLAVTGKNPDLKSYEVQFNFTAPGSMVLQGIRQNDTPQEIERFSLDTQTNLEFTSEPSCTQATIRFLNGKAETELICIGGTLSSPLLTIGLEETASGAAGTAPAHQKSFTIHRAAGIPQIN